MRVATTIAGDKFAQAFNGRRKVFLPVIHVMPRRLGAAISSINTVIAAGADGVWLIDHETASDDAPVKLARFFRRTGPPGFWVGVNTLCCSAADAAAQLCAAGDVDGRAIFDGLWSDDCGEERIDTRLMHFGGVAFKYQREVPPSGYAAAIEAALAVGVDVVTTSGPETGVAASIDKLRAFREVLGDRPLAVASGVSIDNVRAQLPFVDAFLVASSIEHEWGVINYDKARALADAIHER